jgi:heme/copper-type cytochrome/quinol oxidase subunit 2
MTIEQIFLILHILIIVVLSWYAYVVTKKLSQIKEGE